MASQSSFPASSRQRTTGDHGRSATNGTSMLVSRSDGDSDFQSLPALTNASGSAVPGSVSTSMGIRQTRDQNVLAQDQSGVLQARPRHSPPIFECPFFWLPCGYGFSDVTQWIHHSLIHFRHVDPSTSNACCFCEAVFTGETGIDSWQRRMIHVSDHQREGGGSPVRDRTLPFFLSLDEPSDFRCGLPRVANEPGSVASHGGISNPTGLVGRVHRSLYRNAPQHPKTSPSAARYMTDQVERRKESEEAPKRTIWKGRRTNFTTENAQSERTHSNDNTERNPYIDTSDPAKNHQENPPAS